MLIFIKIDSFFGIYCSFKCIAKMLKHSDLAIGRLSGGQQI